MRRVRRVPPFLHGLGPKAIMAHEPRHAMFPHPVALSAERPLDARTPIGLATVVVKQPNGGQQASIGYCPGALGTCPPGIIILQRIRPRLGT